MRTNIVPFDSAGVAISSSPIELVATCANVGPAATTPDHRIVYDSATGALFYDAAGTAGGAAMQFATLSPGLALTAADFMVV